VPATWSRRSVIPSAAPRSAAAGRMTSLCSVPSSATPSTRPDGAFVTCGPTSTTGTWASRTRSSLTLGISSSLQLPRACDPTPQRLLVAVQLGQERGFWRTASLDDPPRRPVADALGQPGEPSLVAESIDRLGDGDQLHGRSRPFGECRRDEQRSRALGCEVDRHDNSIDHHFLPIDDPRPLTSASADDIASGTLLGTLPVRVNTNRISLCPTSATGSNISGHPPSMTVIPCSRP
jgi:hypothetical protein